jgi:predicted aspartyl protease
MKVLSYLTIFIITSSAFAQSPVRSVPFEQFGDHIIFKMSVDGSDPLDFIFDSGAGYTVIDEDVADALELVKDKVIINQDKVRTAIIKHNKIEIDGYLVEKNIKVYSTDLDHLEISLGRDFDGIIGYDLMKHHAVRIDYDNNLFEIYNHGEHPKKGKPIAFKMNTAIPTIEGNVVLNNGEPHPGTFYVMTGAGTTMDFNTHYALNYDVLHKTGEHYSYVVKSVSKDETKHYEGHVKSFSFGTEKFEQMPIGVSQAKSGIQASHKVSGIIGNEILSRYNLEFDLPAKKIYLERNSNYSKPFTINCSGLDVQLSEDKKKVLIHQVFEGSEGEAKGIKVNAELRSLNGKTMDELNLAEVKDMLKQDGETVNVVVFQDGAEKSVSIKLKSIL